MRKGIIKDKHKLTTSCFVLKISLNSPNHEGMPRSDHE